MKAGLIQEIESVRRHATDRECRVFWETMDQINAGRLPRATSGKRRG